MTLTLLHAKLHHLRVTQADLEYLGSLTVDEDLMDAVGIRAYEKVLVANLDNRTPPPTNPKSSASTPTTTSSPKLTKSGQPDLVENRERSVQARRDKPSTATENRTP